MKYYIFFSFKGLIECLKIISKIYFNQRYFDSSRNRERVSHCPFFYIELIYRVRVIPFFIISSLSQAAVVSQRNATALQGELFQLTCLIQFIRFHPIIPTRTKKVQPLKQRAYNKLKSEMHFGAKTSIICLSGCIGLMKEFVDMVGDK